MSLSAQVTKVTAASLERFGFTLFLAIATHAMVILGVGFTAPPPKQPDMSLEVTLAYHKSDQAPDQADFIAQHNQQGSGTEAEVHRTTSTAPAQDQFSNSQAAAGRSPIPIDNQAMALPTPAVTQTKPTQTTDPRRSNGRDAPVVTTQAKRQEKATANEASKTVDPQPASGGSLMSRSLEMAALEAQLAEVSDTLAKRPRVTRLTATATRSREDALYLNNWRDHIERIGNLNYPAEARRKKMYGKARVLVSILPDGSLRSVKILSSSGYPVLDDAVLKIVRLAAPFEPFPPEMRRTTDILEIIRTWKFEKRAIIE